MTLTCLLIATFFITFTIFTPGGFKRKDGILAVKHYVKKIKCYVNKKSNIITKIAFSMVAAHVTER